ncbi:MAG: hypothetical protein AAFZ91_01135 [Pseudomonadota bacterium]
MNQAEGSETRNSHELGSSAERSEDREPARAAAAKLLSAAF